MADALHNAHARLIPPTNPGPIIVAGKGSTVTDDAGRTYIDLEGGPGVSSVGHCHPRIVEAIRDQAGKLIHSPGRYLSHLATSLVARLSELTGGRLNRTFFSNSGAEANDGAIKISLKHALLTGKQGFGIFSLEHSFHGRLSLPLALTGQADRKKGFGPYASFPGVVHVPAPYCYRCPLHLKPDACAGACADVVEESMKTRVPGDVAAMIVEPILAVGGVIIPPKHWWSRIKDFCRKNKITLIVDEVFVGFGRTGKMFAHQHYDVEPQVMTFAKAVAGGVPLAGFSATQEVGDSFEKGDHFSTFGVNNQIGLAAAHAVLDVIKEENIVAEAARKGEKFAEGLRELAKKHEVIGDVRAAGLMIGVELVKDRKTKEPAAELTQKIIADMKTKDVFATSTGAFNCVIRITPPLVISDEQISNVLERLDDSVTALTRASH